MALFIILFGALTLLAGIVITIGPEAIFGYLRRNLDKVGFHVMAVVVRLVLGFFLIYQSDVSKFPLIIEILGWVSIVAAIILAVMGRGFFKRLMSWALSFTKTLGRVGGVLAIVFGGFLIYAFV